MSKLTERLSQMSASKREYTLKALVQHLNRAMQWDKLERILTDIHFLEAKTNAGMVFELAGDFISVVQDMPTIRYLHPLLSLLEEAIQRDIHFIARHPESFFQCLWNACWWYDCPHSDGYYPVSAVDRSTTEPSTEHQSFKLHKLVEEWSHEKKKTSTGLTWLRSLRPPDVRLGEAQTLVLRGHNESIFHIACSVDGSQILSSSFDRSVRAWNSVTGRPLFSFGNIEGGPFAASFLMDGSAIVAVARENNVHVLNVKSASIIAIMEGHEDYIEDLYISDDGQLVVTSSMDGTNRIWDNLSGQEILCIYRKGARSEAMAISRGGEYIATLCSDNILQVINLRGKRKIDYVEDVYDAAELALSPTGDRVAWGGLGAITLYDIKQKRKILQIAPGEALCTTCLIWSADGRSIIAGSHDRTITVWDAHTGKLITCLRGHTQTVECLAMLNTGMSLFSGSEDTTIRKWDLNKSASYHESVGHTDQITGFAMTPESKLVVSGSYDGTLRIWDSRNGSLKCCLVGHSGIINSMILLKDGRQVISCSDDKTIRIWSVEKKEEILCLRGHTKAINVIDVSDNATLAASGSDDGTVRFWDLDEGREIVCLDGHTSFVHSVSISKDLRKIASGACDSTIRIWDVQLSKEIARIHESCKGNTTQTMVRFLKDGKRIAFAWGDHTVRIFNIENGKECARWTCAEQPIASFAVCAQGRYIMAMTSDNRVLVWDGNTYELLDDFTGLLLSEGDLFALSNENRLRWRAVPAELDAAMVSVETDKVVAWCPDRFLSRVPSGNTWVCSVGNFFHMYTLEGTDLTADVPNAILSSSSVKAADGCHPCPRPAKLIFEQFS